MIIFSRGSCSEGDRPNDNFFCEECFTYLYSYDVPPPYSAFTAGTPACVECNSRIAQRRCQGCHNDPLCLTCFPILHRGAVMASHDFLRIDTGECDVLKAGQMFCTECERQKASIVCHQCNDDFCMDCFQITHRRGRRAEHTTSPWEEARGRCVRLIYFSLHHITEYFTIVMILLMKSVLIIFFVRSYD